MQQAAGAGIQSSPAGRGYQESQRGLAAGTIPAEGNCGPTDQGWCYVKTAPAVLQHNVCHVLTL